MIQLINQKFFICRFRYAPTAQRTFEYCSTGGDSGGGLFRFIDNHWELIGVFSAIQIDLKQLQKTGYYGQIMK